MRASTSMPERYHGDKRAHGKGMPQVMDTRPFRLGAQAGFDGEAVEGLSHGLGIKVVPRLETKKACDRGRGQSRSRLAA